MARLSDCVLLVAAKERGYFERQGLNVEFVKHESWAAMRDDLAFGRIDAAHMLSPMVIASAAGLGPFSGQFTTSFVLNLNGNAITVSNALYEQICDASPSAMTRLPMTARGLKMIVDIRRERGEPPLTFGYVYPYSMHAYELRYWMAAAGIRPDEDIHLAVIPPSKMVDSLKAGHIDGYCVGEPWNNAAVMAGIGRTLITSGEIWANRPEKVLAVQTDWARNNRETHLALIRALLNAAAWVDKPSNRASAAEMVARPEYVDASYDQILGSLSGKARQTGGDLLLDMPDFNVFYRYAANFPWRSHAKWVLSQMIRWGDASADLDVDAAAQAAYDPDTFRKAAKQVGAPCPNMNSKIEGVHSHPWLMTDASAPIALGTDLFMDGVIFNPDDVNGYLENFTIQASSNRLKSPFPPEKVAAER